MSSSGEEREMREDEHETSATAAAATKTTTTATSPPPPRREWGLMAEEDDDEDDILVDEDAFGEPLEDGPTAADAIDAPIEYDDDDDDAAAAADDDDAEVVFDEDAAEKKKKQQQQPKQKSEEEKKKPAAPATTKSPAAATTPPLPPPSQQQSSYKAALTATLPADQSPPPPPSQQQQQQQAPKASPQQQQQQRSTTAWRGGDPNALNVLGFRPLDGAARLDRVEDIAELLDAGADPFLRNRKNSTPLHLAAGYGSLRSLKLLVERGHAPVNAIGPNGMTPLDYATQNGRHECAEYLVSKGAHPGVPRDEQQQQQQQQRQSPHSYGPEDEEDQDEAWLPSRFALERFVRGCVFKNASVSEGMPVNKLGRFWHACHRRLCEIVTEPLPEFLATVQGIEVRRLEDGQDYVFPSATQQQQHQQHQQQKPVTPPHFQPQQSQQQQQARPRVHVVTMSHLQAQQKSPKPQQQPQQQQQQQPVLQEIPMPTTSPQVRSPRPDSTGSPSSTGTSSPVLAPIPALPVRVQIPQQPQMPGQRITTPILASSAASSASMLLVRSAGQPVVVTTAPQCTDFLSAARNCPRIAVSCEWSPDRLCVVQVGLPPATGDAPTAVWIFDMVATKTPSDRSAIVSALSELFGGKKPAKVLHDAREVSLVLRRDLGVNLVGVADTQLIEMAQRGDAAKRQPLNKLLDAHRLPSNPLKDALNERARGDPSFWEQRPLTEEMTRYLVGEVFSLLDLHSALEQKLASQRPRASDASKQLMQLLGVNSDERSGQSKAAAAIFECPSHMLEKELFLSFLDRDMPVYSALPPRGASNFVPFDMRELEEIGANALASILQLLPPLLRTGPILAIPAWQIDEIVLDMGRKPLLRLTDGSTLELSSTIVDAKAIHDGLLLLRQAVGVAPPREGEDPSFGIFTSNRFGVPNTLHRVSCVRFFNGSIIGMIYHVGKHLPGAISILRDLLRECCPPAASGNRGGGGCGQAPKSLLVLGRPGSGRTTLLREASRCLSDELNQRVVIVDTNAEIAGGGVSPHACVGKCRRLFVPELSKQDQVMQEAILGHKPSVVVVDEIGEAKEVEVARQIVQRGVSLVCSAHGSDLCSLLHNSILRPIVGGVQAKAAPSAAAAATAPPSSSPPEQYQRVGAPFFDIVVEILDHNDFLIHRSSSKAVDSVLSGASFTAERRWFDKDTGVMMAKFTSVAAEKFDI